MISFVQRGDLSKTEKMLNSLLALNIPDRLKKFGDKGVATLAMHTPRDSSQTADSWYYEIEIKGKGEYVIHWCNSNTNNGVSIAVILQYGHGTRNGGYVMGRDYINPAMQPIFDAIAEEAWREVIKNG